MSLVWQHFEEAQILQFVVSYIKYTDHIFSVTLLLLSVTLLWIVKFW